MKAIILALVLTLSALPALAQAVCITQTAGEQTVVLTWINNDTTTTDTVNILRGTAPGTETFLVNVPYGTTYTDTVPVAPASTTYYYVVQAKVPATGVVSAVSNEVCKTFSGPLAAPSGLTVR